MNLIPWRGKREEVDWDDFWSRSPLATFRTEMDRLFDRFLAGSETAFGPGRWGDWAPSLDITETEKDVTVRAEVPGVDPKELEITVSGQVLTLAGQKKEFTEHKGENFHHSERRFGSFRRSIQLPASVDSEKISAEHKNGVVTIKLHKIASAAPKRIPVRSASE